MLHEADNDGDTTFLERPDNDRLINAIKNLSQTEAWKRRDKKVLLSFFKRADRIFKKDNLEEWPLFQCWMVWCFFVQSKWLESQQSSKSRIRNLQSIGRGLRLGDNKVNATLYDIADDLTYKSKENFTLKHFQERINIYTEEEFDYEMHNIDLKE